MVVNKADLVDKQELKRVEDRVRAINSLAKVTITERSKVPDLSGFILDLHAYDEVEVGDLSFATKGHSHLDPAISTATIVVPALREEQVERFDRWLRTVLWEETLPGREARDFEVHRLTGRIPVQGVTVWLVQGVRNVYDVNEGKDTDEKDQEAKLVLIGKGVGQEGFRESLLEVLG